MAVLKDQEDEEKWKMLFDGASNSLGQARLGFNCTNNMVEYKPCAIGITMAIEYQVKIHEVYGDSTLVIH
ncbi:hypothetical protein CR513_11025, partial [Mucuna pruriens]